MIRLFFVKGPFDGGSADFDGPRVKSKKAARKGETTLPLNAYVACGDYSVTAWVYRLTRAITPYSAEYTLTGWVGLDAIPRDAIFVLIAP